MTPSACRHHFLLKSYSLHAYKVENHTLLLNTALLLVTFILHPERVLSILLNNLKFNKCPQSSKNQNHDHMSFLRDNQISQTSCVFIKPFMTFYSYNLS